MARSPAVLGAALSLAVSACSVSVPPFVGAPPGGGDGGIQPIPDGGFYVLYVLPSSGTDLGGDVVTIGGGGFEPAASVTFGAGIPATSTLVIDGGTISAVTPPSPAGVVDVTVQNPDGGQAVLPGGYDFVP